MPPSPACSSRNGRRTTESTPQRSFPDPLETFLVSPANACTENPDLSTFPWFRPTRARDTSKAVSAPAMQPHASPCPGVRNRPVDATNPRAPRRPCWSQVDRPCARSADEPPLQGTAIYVENFYVDFFYINRTSCSFPRPSPVGAENRACRSERRSAPRSRWLTGRNFLARHVYFAGPARPMSSN